MKTLEQSAKDYAEITELFTGTDKNEIERAFLKGAEFANTWIPIQRDKMGLTTKKQESYFLANLPIIVKSKYGYEVFEELSTDLDKQEYTHWKPIK